jgi:hypothetical protein
MALFCVLPPSHAQTSHAYRANMIRLLNLTDDFLDKLPHCTRTDFGSVRKGSRPGLSTLVQVLYSKPYENFTAKQCTFLEFNS